MPTPGPFSHLPVPKEELQSADLFPRVATASGDSVSWELLRAVWDLHRLLRCRGGAIIGPCGSRSGATSPRMFERRSVAPPGSQARTAAAGTVSAPTSPKDSVGSGRSSSVPVGGTCCHETTGN